MTLDNPLYQGKLIYFAAPDPDRDAGVEAEWSRDPEFLHLVSADPICPITAFDIKKRYEEYSKDQMRYRFCIRTLSDDRTVGYVDLNNISWTNRLAELSLAIGKPQDRSQGYGREALRMMLRLAFDELNLYRMAVTVFEYNLQGIDFLLKNGFKIEVRMRESIHRFGRRWDTLLLGILNDDWRALRREWEVE